MAILGNESDGVNLEEELKEKFSNAKSALIWLSNVKNYDDIEPEKIAYYALKELDNTWSEK